MKEEMVHMRRTLQMIRRLSIEFDSMDRTFSRNVSFGYLSIN